VENFVHQTYFTEYAVVWKAKLTKLAADYPLILGQNFNWGLTALTGFHTVGGIYPRLEFDIGGYPPHQLGSFFGNFFLVLNNYV
jgi:hypothetical protein